MATDNAKPSDAKAPTGHPIGFWFFFWGEFAERCSYYGMRAILALYMTEQLGVDKADAGTFMSFFIAACYFFPLIGGYIADNFFGKYWTIVGFSMPYVVAQYLVGIENRYVVFGALALLAMGSGVIKPNISTLMGLTYDQQRPGQTQLRTSAFNWFYMAINIGAALSQFAMPWLRTEFGYKTAFLFPAALMALALFIFMIGKRFYANEVITRSVVGTTAPPDGTTMTGLPIRYKAVTPEEKAAERDLKRQTLMRIGSVFLLVMFFWAIFDQAASTWIFFADTYMDCTLFGLPVSADAIQGFNPIFIILMVPISVWLFKTLDQKGWKVKATQKMTIGFILTGVSMVIMSISGFLAGEKQSAFKVTLKEGVLYLPSNDAKLADVPVKDKAASLELPGSVAITAADWTFNPTNKKVTFTDGRIKFANGQELWIVNGRADFDKSRSLFGSGGAFEPPGALEAQLKAGDYRMGTDRLTVGKGNSITIAKAETPAPEDSVTPKVMLEPTEWVKPNERVTVWWQVLAFLIITMAEILISVTGLELAFVAAPDSMKSFITACWLATVGFANLVINAPITQLYPLVEPGVYFAALAAAMAIVTVAFIPVAARFNRGMAEASGSPDTKLGETETV